MKRLLAVLVLLVGCQEPFSNEDILFLKALPRGLSIDVPDETSAQGLSPAAETRERAKYYLEARRNAEAINKGIFEWINAVDQVLQFEPTARDENVRLWGPYPIDHRIEMKLLIQRTVTSTAAPVQFTSTSTPTEISECYTYLFEFRLIGTERWFQVFGGTFCPYESSGARGVGNLGLNCDAVRIMDPRVGDECPGHIIYVGYDTRFEQVSIDLVIDTKIELTPPFEPEVGYLYRRNDAGDGAFAFALWEDHIDTTPAVELLFITARWLADRRGIALVNVSRGDAGLGYSTYQCWDEQFYSTFLMHQWLIPVVVHGSQDNCAPELLPDL